MEALDFNNIFGDGNQSSSWNIASLKDTRQLKTSIHHWLVVNLRLTKKKKKIE